MESDPASSNKLRFALPTVGIDLPTVPFAFYPSTKEREPDVPEPFPDMYAAGVSYQQFGSNGWGNIDIRYVEAQKALQASGSFARLQVNPELYQRW